MEIEIKPVTDEIRFATVLSDITDSIDSNRVMAIGQLWWIIPITLLTGAWIGAVIYGDKQKKKDSTQELVIPFI